MIQKVFCNNLLQMRRSSLVLFAALAVAFSAMSETVWVSSFGQGKSIAEAVDSAKKQALIDVATNLPSDGSDVGATSLGTRAKSKIQSFKTLRVARLATKQYEVEITAAVLVASAAQINQGVALIPAIDHGYVSATNVVIDEVRDKVIQSDQFYLVEYDQASSESLLERLRISHAGRRNISAAMQSATPVDFVCIVSVEVLPTEKNGSGVETYAVAAKVVLIDSFGDRYRQVSTIKSTISGASVKDNGAVSQLVSKQVTRLISEYAKSSAFVERWEMLPRGTKALAARNRHGVILESDW